MQPSYISVGGSWGAILESTCQKWMLHVDENLLLSGFRHRPGIQPWIGEHIGKYLLGAIPTSQMLRCTELAEKAQRLVEELVKCQEEDGYLGTYLKEGRWLGYGDVGPGDVWDVWVHKYCILALLAYQEFAGWEPALEAAVKAADLLLKEFGPGRRDINKCDYHTGLASGSVLEPIMLLYQRTGEQRYLDFAHHLLSRWEAPDGPRIMPVLRERGDVSTIGNGKAYEMLSCFVGLVEYARVTGDREVLQLVLEARDRIADTQRYPTGGMSNKEHFWRPGLSPEWGSMETCVTFTWIQLNLRLFELTGDERALDLVEEAAWNQLLPAVSPQHDTWSYHLSMTGPKRFFKEWIQGVDKGKTSFGGAPLTCCHTNGQRGLALAPLYTYGVTPQGALAVNLYGESEGWLELPGVGRVQITQHTDFPRAERVTLQVIPEGDGEYELLLRRPPWVNAVVVDGQKAAESGRRIIVRRSGRATVHICLEMGPHVRMCGFEARGKCAIAYGPLILAMDHAPKGLDLDQVALVLGRSEITRNLSVLMENGWPVVDVPVAGIPKFAVFDAGVELAGTVRLRPVLFAGLEGNPGLERVINGTAMPSYNLAKKRQTLFPEYRVLLPFFWCPG